MGSKNLEYGRSGIEGIASRNYCGGQGQLVGSRTRRRHINLGLGVHTWNGRARGLERGLGDGVILRN